MKPLYQYITEKILIDKDSKYHKDIKQSFYDILQFDIAHEFYNDLEEYCKKIGQNKLMAFISESDANYYDINSDNCTVISNSEFDSMVNDLSQMDYGEICEYNDINLKNKNRKGDDWIRIIGTCVDPSICIDTNYFTMIVHF